MSIFTEEAERRGKEQAKVVAECWTCWECSSIKQHRADPQRLHSCFNHRKPTIVDMELERVSPRHLGHDVRERKA